MRARLSPLKLIDFTVFRSHIDFITTDDPKTVHLSGLPVNIDFEIYEPERSDGRIRIVEMVISTNKSGKKPGYKIDCRASGVFEIETNPAIPQHDREHLFGVTTLNLMISHLRGYLKNVTSYGAYGAYLLPSIDIQHLIEARPGNT